MTPVIQCPECATSDCYPIDNNQYKCRNCGTVFKTNLSVETTVPINEMNKPSGNARMNITLGIILMAGIFAYGIYSVNKTTNNNDPKSKQSLLNNRDAEDAQPKYSESTQSFIAVPGKFNPEIWLVKRRNSSDLKEVDYRIAVEDPITKKEIYSRPVMNTITWDQSFEKDFQVGRIKRAGSRCWLIIGGKSLVGYDIATRQKTIDNDILSAQYHQFSDGISYVDDLVNVAAFKVTSTEGITYYYLPEEGKILTEVEYDNVRRNENTNNNSWAFQTQYVFSQDQPQHLYKLIRRQQNLRMRKIYPDEVQQILNDPSLWYRKMYNVVSMNEFTPGKTYYNGSVIYNDNSYCVLISTADSSSDGPIILQCLDKNRDMYWADSGNTVEEFRPFLKANFVDAFLLNGELVFQIPNQEVLTVSLHTGKIVWKYKVVEAPS